jgi:hypothetical protein
MWNKIRENSELAVSGVLLLLLITCIDPFESLMPSGWDRTLVVLLIALYGFYTGIVFRERAKDERERLHLALAERWGFLVGTGLLVLFIILDLLTAAPAKSLVFVLGGMSFTKLIVLLVVRYRN